MPNIIVLVAEWIHFTLVGIILPTIKLKVRTLGGLMNSATKVLASLQGFGALVQKSGWMPLKEGREARATRDCNTSA